jgi:hypothetical protein
MNNNLLDDHQIITGLIGTAAQLPAEDPRAARWAREALALASAAELPILIEEAVGVLGRITRHHLPVVRRAAGSSHPGRVLLVHPLNQALRGSRSYNGAGTPHGLEYRRQHCRCRPRRRSIPMPRVPTISRYERPPAERRTGEHRHPTPKAGPRTRCAALLSFEPHAAGGPPPQSPRPVVRVNDCCRNRHTVSCVQ